MSDQTLHFHEMQHSGQLTQHLRALAHNPSGRPTRLMFTRPLSLRHPKGSRRENRFRHGHCSQ